AQDLRHRLRLGADPRLFPGRPGGQHPLHLSHRCQRRGRDRGRGLLHPDPVHPPEARQSPGRRRLHLRGRGPVQAVHHGHQQVGRRRPGPRRGFRRHPPHAVPGARPAVPGPQDARGNRACGAEGQL
ncbi:RidA/YER057c/UK114 superfamily, group 6, partial [Arthrobacter sp. DR-2P]